MEAAVCVAVGYFIGTVNPAYYFGKRKGFDIRKRGSGNAGATNATLTMGSLIGAFCAILDIIKAFLAYRLVKIMFPAVHFAGILSGCACILGHIFPVWMGFRGGKGLACLGGVILGYNWKLFCILLIFEVILVLTVNYICVVAMSGSVIFAAMYGISTHDFVGTAALFIVAAIIQYKHIDNVKRIQAGTEFHVSYLWDKEKEIERVTKILGDERIDELF